MLHARANGLGGPPGPLTKTGAPRRPFRVRSTNVGPLAFARFYAAKFPLTRFAGTASQYFGFALRSSMTVCAQASMVISGTWPSAIVLAASCVAKPFSVPLSNTSLAHPEPKCVPTAFESCCVQASTKPKSRSIAASTSILVRPPPFGDSEWQSNA